MLLLTVLLFVAGLLALAVRHERSPEEVEDAITPITGAPSG